jgi:hypothetical protein
MAQTIENYPFFDLPSYFNVKSCADIPWGHAINSKQKLLDALQKDIMLEADICVSDSDPSRIVMAHPPIREGDLTLEEWVNLVLDHCKANPGLKVGMKLDFKDPPAVEPSLLFLAQLHQKGALNVPFWINADILFCAGRQTPFNPDDFIGVAQRLLPGVVLSVGWTTLESHPYTMSNIDEMLAICAKHSLKNTTFPMRASLCKSSAKELHALLNADPTYTLTIWAGQEGIPIAEYQWLKEEFDNTRLFFDIPLN